MEMERFAPRSTRSEAGSHDWVIDPKPTHYWSPIPFGCRVSKYCGEALFPE